jgi:hypothetical protein
MWYIRCAGWSVLAVSFWGATAISFFGWGVLCRAGLRLPPPTRLRRTNTCLFGICGTFLALQLAHCAVAIDALVLGIWYLVGVSGAIVGVRCLRTRIRSREKRTILSFAVVAGWMLYVAYSAMTRIPQADPYHFIAIRWQQVFPVVPGLANLDGRLGFNTASFLLHSMFSNVFQEFGLTFFHGALYLILLSCAIHAVARSAAKRRIFVADACDILMICPLIVIGLEYRNTFAIANVTPDLTLFMLQIALVRSWVAGVESLASQRPSTICIERLALALLLGVACICVKLSSGVFSALLICMPTLYLITNRNDPTIRCNVSWQRLIWATLAFCTIWTGRGIVLSGYPLYPSSMCALPVDWRVAETMRIEELKMISDCGRYAQCMSGPAPPWIEDWLRRFCDISWTNPSKSNTLGRSLLPACLILLGVVWWASAKRSQHNRHDAWLPLFSAAGGISITVWFAIAPDPRFVVGIVYGFVIVFFAPIICRMSQRQRGMLVGMLVVIVGFVGLYDRARAEYARGNPLGCVIATLLVPPPPCALGRFVIPTPHILNEFRCDSGLTIYLCDGGDYTWHAPLATVGSLYAGWNRLKLRSPHFGLEFGFCTLVEMDASNAIHAQVNRQQIHDIDRQY